MTITVRTGATGAVYPNQTTTTSQGTGFQSTLDNANGKTGASTTRGPGPMDGEGFEDSLRQAGGDPDQFKAAMDEARDRGVKPGSQEFNSILQSHGIDPSKLPQPPQGGQGSRPDGREQFQKALEQAGIDPTEFKAAMDEAREKGVKPGSQDFNAILQAHGIDPTAVSKLPMPHESGSQGNPSKDGRQLDLSSIDSSSFLDRALPDEKKAQPVGDDKYV